MHRVRKIPTWFAPILGAGGVGVCPLCWAGSASLLTYLGLAGLVPYWRWISFGLIGLGLIGFFLDYRSHRKPAPMLLLVSGGLLLYLGRYVFAVQPNIHIFSGIEGFAGWPIWGVGALLVVLAVVLNKRFFRKPAPHQYLPSAP